MFTGLVEDVGTVMEVRQQTRSMRLVLEPKKFGGDLQLGDSVAVNGACLTVSSLSGDRFAVDVMPETVKSTNIRLLRAGHRINLERAMPADSRFGGHFVSGHVDGTGKIVRKNNAENAVYIDIEVNPTLSRQCILKGSVTIDGVSLTVFGLEENRLTISLIPHTLQETILGSKRLKDEVNIETDILGKYVISQLEKKAGTDSLDLDFLRKNGF